MNLLDIFGASPTSAQIGSAAAGASSTAASQAGLGNYLSGFYQNTINPAISGLNSLGYNTFASMLKGGDPTGITGQGITGVNANRDNARRMISANFAGDGTVGSGFMQDALARNEMGRASDVSTLQNQGRMAGMNGIMQLLQGLRYDQNSMIGGANSAYSGATGGYGTTGNLYTLEGQALNSGNQNFLNLLGGGANAVGSGMGMGMGLKMGSMFA